ncbi:hypothetical protein E2C01_038973 [Portunus trituberculatus]|uniref:Uncharacterized protein n=1 Tax=Portunus trituberculatus TaxID=210409 RepID=A0A5B7FJY4_PORTR|nr:hypothetical protein [Portunus trituberculatus]
MAAQRWLTLCVEPGRRGAASLDSRSSKEYLHQGQHSAGDAAGLPQEHLTHERRSLRPPQRDYTSVCPAGVLVTTLAHILHLASLLPCKCCDILENTNISCNQGTSFVILQPPVFPHSAAPVSLPGVEVPVLCNVGVFPAIKSWKGCYTSIMRTAAVVRTVNFRRHYLAAGAITIHRPRHHAEASGWVPPCSLNHATIDSDSRQDHDLR